MNITIAGGSGFIGKYLVSKLDLNHQITILTRQKQEDSFFTSIKNVKAICSFNYSEDQLNNAFKDQDLVINLIGILNEKGHSGKGFYKAHVELTQNILNACKTNKIERYLHMSALHANLKAGPSHYLRSKGQAEDFVHQNHSNNLAVTSFCPSVIFGPGDSFCNRFAQLLKFMPFVFPLACANSRFAPIYAGDVADIMLTSINDQDTYNKRINLCGAETYTLAEIVQLTAKAMNKNITIIKLPKLLSYWQAAIFDYCVPNKPLSIDNFNSLQVDSVCDSAPLGTTSFKKTINTYVYLSNEQQNHSIMHS